MSLNKVSCSQTLLRSGCLLAVWLLWVTDGVMALSGVVKGCSWLGSTAKTDVTSNCDAAFQFAASPGLRHKIKLSPDVFFCGRTFCIVPLSLWLLCCLSCCVDFVWGLVWSVTGHWLSQKLSFDSPAEFWELCLSNCVMMETVGDKPPVKQTFFPRCAIYLPSLSWILRSALTDRFSIINSMFCSSFLTFYFLSSSLSYCL